MKHLYLSLLIPLLLGFQFALGQAVDNNKDGFDDLTGKTITASYLLKDTGDVVHSIPLPSRYCWALTWDGEALWTANYVTKTLIKLDPETGNELLSFAYPTVVKYIEGLAWDGEYLWATGWYESNGNGSHIFKIDPQTGEKLKDHLYPSSDPWPHGLAYDGQWLWSANYIYEGTSTMDKIEPNSGELIDSYNIIDHHYFGLTCDGNSLWCSDMDNHMLYEIRYPSAFVELEVYAPCGNPRDMAWDGEYLWVVSWENETIYQINVGPAGIHEENHNSISVYPNPANSTSVIAFIPKKTGNIHFTLINILGEVVAETKKDVTSGNKFIFPLNELLPTPADNGIFLLKSEMGKNSNVCKIIF